MPHNVPLSTDVFDVMHSLRAMRRLKPDPVPDALIAKILRAGQAAASGGNTQRWKFLVLKDPAKKKAVQVYYKRLLRRGRSGRHAYATSAPPPGSNPEAYKARASTTPAVKYLTDPLSEAPVWIVAACLGRRQPPTAPPVRRSIRRCRTCCWRRGRWAWARP